MKNKIRETRIIERITIKSAAKSLGITSNGYAKKENGTNEFKVSEAIKLCELFDKKFSELFDQEVVKMKEGEEE